VVVKEKLAVFSEAKKPKQADILLLKLLLPALLLLLLS
jgi:hypothetical protein